MNQRQLEMVLEAIAATRDGELACADLDAQRLAEFVDLELAGEQAERHMPEVARHLALCPDCRRDYRAVLALLRAVQADELVEPKTLPNFDLSFLSRTGTRHAPWRQLTDNVRRYADALPVLVLRELQRLGRLPAGVTLHPAAPALQRMRGPTRDEPPISLRLADEATGFAADLSIRLADTDVAWIVVHPVFVQPDAAGSSVALLDDAGRPVELRAVSEGDTVEFRDVPLEETVGLRFQSGGAVWEVVLDLRALESGADVAE